MNSGFGMEMHRGMIRVLAAGVAAVALGLGPAARSQEASPEASPDYKNPRLPVERRVADLLSRMTLEEKAAQTHAIWQQKASIVDEKGAFSPKKARAVLRHGIGQVTRPNERRGPRESAEFVNAIQRWVVENTRLGIPVMFHEEGLHGQQSPGGTNFPVPIALASSWDPALMHDVFSAVALEIRARGSQQVLAPVLTSRATRAGAAPRRPTARTRTSSRAWASPSSRPTRAAPAPSSTATT
jgi:beta-glucosidase